MTRPKVRRAVAGGLERLVLENAALQVTVLPALGGHVSELIDRAAVRDVLWHNPRTAPRPAPYGAHFDDWWSGGWDEIFPSGDRGTLHDELLPYMGELWCVPWTAEVSASGDEASISAVGYGTIAPARFERRLTLRGDEPVLRVQYRIENLDVRPLPYTWGIHPAFAVTPCPSHRPSGPGDARRLRLRPEPGRCREPVLLAGPARWIAFVRDPRRSSGATSRRCCLRRSLGRRTCPRAGSP